jgi:hypothetical protein
MKKYIVRFYGWEEEMNGFNLSQEQADKLDEALESGEYESLDHTFMFMMKMRMNYSPLVWMKWVILKTITKNTIMKM